MIYAQVINGMVNLIGGIEVGLPYNNEIAQSIDITNLSENERPKEGWFYKDGVFNEIGELSLPSKTDVELLTERVVITEETQTKVVDALVAITGVTL